MSKNSIWILSLSSVFAVVLVITIIVESNALEQERNSTKKENVADQVVNGEEGEVLTADGKNIFTFEQIKTRSANNLDLSTFVNKLNIPKDSLKKQFVSTRFRPMKMPEVYEVFWYDHTGTVKYISQIPISKGKICYSKIFPVHDMKLDILESDDKFVSFKWEHIALNKDDKLNLVVKDGDLVLERIDVTKKRDFKYKNAQILRKKGIRFELEAHSQKYNLINNMIPFRRTGANPE